MPRCAAWFIQLGLHVVRTHGLHADEYKAYFGLRVSTGLVGPLIREALRVKAERDLAPHRDEGPKALRQLSSEQRAQYARGRSLPVESRRDPAVQAQWRKAGQHTHEEYLRGAWTPPIPRLDPHELGRRAQATFRQRLRDPVFRAHWTEALSQAQGGRVTVHCRTCGRAFRVQPFRVRLGQCKYCSRACTPSPATRTEVRAKISAAARRRGRAAGAQLHALPPSRFAFLSSSDRDMLRLYYGLDDEQPHTLREIGAEYGIVHWRVKTIIAKAVARLLEPEQPASSR